MSYVSFPASSVTAKYGGCEIRMEVFIDTVEEWEIFSRKYFIMAIFCGITRGTVFQTLDELRNDINSSPVSDDERDLSEKWRGNYNAKVSKWFQAVMYCNNYDLFTSKADGIVLQLS